MNLVRELHMLQMSEEQVEKAISVLEQGGVIVYPTETTYGLGCDATNPEAVARIFSIKGRPSGKGLPLIIPDKLYAENVIEMNETAAMLAEKYWPGGLNIIAPVKESSLVAEQCSQDGTQSVRVSSHPFAATIARRLGKPIVATSANVSGQGAIYEVKHVRELFKDQPDKPDYIVDGGKLPARPASTTVKVLGERIEMIREGEIHVEL